MRSVDPLWRLGVQEVHAEEQSSGTEGVKVEAEWEAVLQMHAWWLASWE